MTEVLVEGCKGCMNFTGHQLPELYFSEAGHIICMTGSYSRNKAPRIHPTNVAGTFVCSHLDCPSRIAGTQRPDRVAKVRGA